MKAARFGQLGGIKMSNCSLYVRSAPETVEGEYILHIYMYAYIIIIEIMITDISGRPKCIILVAVDYINPKFASATTKRLSLDYDVVKVFWFDRGGGIVVSMAGKGEGTSVSVIIIGVMLSISIMMWEQVRTTNIMSVVRA